MTRHRTNPLRERKNIALIALVAISAFALMYTPVRSALTQGIYTVSPSLWKIEEEGQKSVVRSFLSNFYDKEALVKENDDLRAELNRMQAQVLDRNLLAEKVMKLEESLGRVRSDDRVVANVLAGPEKSPYDTLIIDAGEEQGIQVGNMVVYAGSGVVGQIVEVTSVTAKVKLLSSPGEEHTVIIGQHYIPVLALGRGMGNFEAKVPQESIISVGDNVLTTKGNLLLGKISVIEEKPAEPIKRLFFRLPFNIAEMRTVEVIVSKRL